MISIGIADKVTLDAVDTNVNTANAKIGTIDTNVNTANAKIGTIDTNVNTANARIGTDADSASATGSLHAKVRDIKDFLPRLKKATIIVGDNIRISADTERTLVGVTDYTKLKEIKIGEYGTYRVSFEGKRGTSSSYLRIFVNGVTKGIQRSLDTHYKVFTEDVSLNAGDLVQIYGRTDYESGTVYLKNFKIAWDYYRNEVILD